MPSLEDAILTRLTTYSEVTAIAGTRAYLNVLPQGVVYPAIRLQRISTPRLRGLSGPLGRARPRMQVDCWARVPSQVIALSQAIRGALDGFRGMSAGVPIDSSGAEDEDGGYDDEVQAHRARIDFILSHVEV